MISEVNKRCLVSFLVTDLVGSGSVTATLQYDDYSVPHSKYNKIYWIRLVLSTFLIGILEVGIIFESDLVS